MFFIFLMDYLYLNNYMKKTLIIAMLLGIGIQVFAQNCGSYFTQKQGTVLQFTNYDKNNKVESYSETKLDKIEASQVAVTVRELDKKKVQQSEVKATVTCNGGRMIFDMKGQMGKQAAGFPDATITGDNLEYPSVMTVGQELKDCSVKIGSPQLPFSLEMQINNRKVVAKETITTAAGTFECYKITYSVTTKMMMDIKMTGIQWYSTTLGVIKIQSFDTAGQLQSVSQLEAIN